MPEHGVEGDQQLAHHRRQRDLGRLAPADQRPVGEREARAAAARAQDRHVQRPAHGPAAALDLAPAPPLPAVPRDRRQPDQAGDLAPVERAEFRQLGQEGRDQDRADPRRGPQQGGGGREVRVGRDRLGQQRVELRLLPPQPVEGGAGALDQGRRAQVAELLAAGGDLGQELAAVGQELGQAPPRGVGDRGRRRPGERAVPGDHGGVDAVGLGQHAARLGEVAHALGVDDRGRGPAPGHGLVQPPLVAAGRFHHDQAARLQPAGQPLDPGRVVVDREPPLASQAAGVEPGLADVDADDVSPSPVPSLSAVLIRPTIFGLKRRRGGTVLGRGLLPGVRSASPTPRARPVHGPGATTLCHTRPRQGSFGHSPAMAASSSASAAAASSSSGSRPAARARAKRLQLLPGALGGELGLAAVAEDQGPGGAGAGRGEVASLLDGLGHELRLEALGAGGAEVGAGDRLGEVAGVGAGVGQLAAVGGEVGVEDGPGLAEGRDGSEGAGAQAVAGGVAGGAALPSGMSGPRRRRSGGRSRRGSVCGGAGRSCKGNVLGRRLRTR